MLELLAAFDFSNILTLVKDNILPIILGSQLIPVNKPGTPYTPLIKTLLSILTGRKTVEVPVVPGTPAPTPGTPVISSNILTMLLPLIQQLSQKPPIATVVPSPDPTTVPSDPNSMIAWLMKLINSPEVPVAPTAPKDPPLSDVRWEHFSGCFYAMVELHPDWDITAISKNGNTEVKKTARTEKKSSGKP